MLITIQSVNVETKPTSKGSYQVAVVAYKSEQGKIEGRNVMSFGDSAEAFKTLSQATYGEVYDVTAVKKPGKDGKEYWNWISATRSSGAAAAPTQQYGNKAAGNAAPRSNYETPEERAQRQVYIIRQSSLSNAIAALSVGAKSAPKSGDIVALAKEFEDYVFGSATKDVEDTTMVKKEEDDFDQSIPF